MKPQTSHSSEKLKKIMQPKYQVNLHQKSQTQIYNPSSLQIQPLSQMLNLNLKKQITDKHQVSSNYSSQNQFMQIFQQVSENKNQKIDQNSISQQKKYTQFIKKNYQNGIYFGQMNCNTPDGEGGFFWDNGCFYYGQWKNGLMHGCGLFIFKTGSVLRGNFKKGQANGLAELSFFPSFQQQILNGFWIDGQFEGSSPAQFYKNGFNQVTNFDEKNQSEGKKLQVAFFSDKIESKQKDNSQSQFEINPYYYDAELKKRLENYIACENSIEVGERKSNLLNGLAIRFHFDGKIEFGSFKKGLLEGRGKIIFKTGDIYDGYFINSIFQGPGVYYNNQDKVWAYGAFSKNKIMYLQQQNTSYPPPALYDLREKDEYVDSSDRLIGENQLRDRNIVLDTVLVEDIQKRANGEVIQHQTRTNQTTQADQTEEELDAGVRQYSQISPFSGAVEQNKMSSYYNPEFVNQAGLRKTADFGNTIKNLSSIFQASPNNLQEDTINRDQELINTSHDKVRKSIEEKIIEKQLESDNEANNQNSNQSHPSQQLETHQTVIQFSPKSQNYLTSRNKTANNLENNLTHDNLEFPCEFTQKYYYGISEETYQIIQELEKKEIIQKKREKSLEKISQIKALITNYLSQPQNLLVSTPNNKKSLQRNQQTNIDKQNSLNKTTTRSNNENINPQIKRNPSSVSSYSTRNQFSGVLSSQKPKSNYQNREQPRKIQTFEDQSISSRNMQGKNNSIKNNNHVQIQNEITSRQNSQKVNNNFIGNQTFQNIYKNNELFQPFQIQDINNTQNKCSFNEKQKHNFQANPEKQNRVSINSSKSNSQVQQSSPNQFKKIQQRIKNFSQQYEAQNQINYQQGNKNKQNIIFKNFEHIQSENTPISSPHNYQANLNPQNQQSTKNNHPNEPQKQFFFTQSCRNHKRHVSSISFSSNNQVGNTQIQPKRSQYPLSIQIY
ncbi:MORN motif protein (macronuclear) [Tetrahymena thermophila SB210]|uniref:MORN motif protein n=1 Tax=Tetrahymena thermophila (strain SB210) TaxID=312017 RepID=I7MDS9_TETTS|nr:MORN motif protein [Tetrahymena thermophila SB210]EAR90888.2 MORN motif protein [Tetrahymena thermophila SB210]|eukprot:XP_001011133.2 MORN motif protein [Tetrahymena thermophila SB210]